MELSIFSMEGPHYITPQYIFHLFIIQIVIYLMNMFLQAFLVSLPGNLVCTGNNLQFHVII